MSKRYNQLPSDILHITDDYIAFCFDEACSEILARLESGDEPVWKEDIEAEEERKQNKIHYSSFKDMYKNM